MKCVSSTFGLTVILRVCIKMMRQILLFSDWPICNYICKKHFKRIIVVHKVSICIDIILNCIVYACL